MLRGIPQGPEDRTDEICRRAFYLWMQKDSTFSILSHPAFFVNCAPANTFKKRMKTRGFSQGLRYSEFRQIKGARIYGFRATDAKIFIFYPSAECFQSHSAVPIDIKRIGVVYFKRDNPVYRDK